MMCSRTHKSPPQLLHPTPSSSSSDANLTHSSPSHGKHVLAVTASVTLFWLMVSLIPIYNKYFFKQEFYPYPIATAAIQLGCVCILLSIINAVQHYLATRQHNQFNYDGGQEHRKSWIFGPHLLWKLRVILPIGFLFGIKYGVTNLGLHLIPAPTHLLLQSTDLIWCILGAWFVNGERTSMIGMFCLCGCVAGSFILSVQVGQNTAAPVAAIAVNLLSPMLMGLCVATLRSACVVLMNNNNRVGGAVSAIELTAIKLCISSLVALALAMAFEGRDESAEEIGWLDSFHNLPSTVKLGVMGGCIPILIFQVNCTYLTHLTSSVAVGLVGQLKIIPQWTVATIFSSDVHFHLSGLNIMGAVLTMISAATFAVHEYVIYSTTSQMERIRSETDVNSSGSDVEAEESALIGIVSLNTSPMYGAIPATTGKIPTLEV